MQTETEKYPKNADVSGPYTSHRNAQWIKRMIQDVADLIILNGYSGD